jgi:hypothetical protein
MAEPKPLSSDVYSPYESGLRLMLDKLGRDHSRYSETLVYQQRLTDNISQARRYGDTDTRKSERAEVIDRLNELSLAVLGMAFNELCDQASPSPTRTHDPPDGLVHKPRIFLCHAKEDKPRVKELYHQLKEAGYHPWLDEEDLLPGQDWWAEIKKIISDPYNLVVVCLSDQSVTKRGVVQREIKRALDVLDQMPESAIYLIPARLEPCQVPDRLSRLHWVNLFERQGFEKLRQALDFEVNKRNISPSDEWPKVARIVDRAGKNLKLRFGEEPLTAEHIQREVERLGGFAKGAIIPADYCYNRINKAPNAFRYPVFERVERGKFIYLGPHYNYTGPIFWKPRGAPERQVGEWRSGVCHLWEDPRNA